MEAGRAERQESEDKMRMDTGKNALLPVVECFYSLQGEGAHAGWPAFFIRLAGCRNACSFCDTKESWSEEGYPRLSPEELAKKVLASGAKACVLTGGEPLLHDLTALCRCLKDAGIDLWLETSGSEPLSGQWDWVCLSPKKGIPVDGSCYAAASELKMVVESPADFVFAEEQAGKVGAHCLCYLQSEWSVSSDMLPGILSYIMRYPGWKLSLQQHKILNVR